MGVCVCSPECRKQAEREAATEMADALEAVWGQMKSQLNPVVVGGRVHDLVQSALTKAGRLS
jgi:hypothetical protein